MQTHFSISTRRAAQLAGVEPHVLITALGRHGHWKGVTPRKMPNGRLLWPSLDIYAAIGKLPPPLNRPVDRLRDHLASVSGADPFAAHQIAAALLADGAQRPQQAELFTDPQAEGALFADLAAVLSIVKAAASRIGSTISRLEGRESPDMWAKLNQTADRFKTEVEHLCRPMTWVRADVKGASHV